MLLEPELADGAGLSAFLVSVEVVDDDVSEADELLEESELVDGAAAAALPPPEFDRASVL